MYLRFQVVEERPTAVAPCGLDECHAAVVIIMSLDFAVSSTIKAIGLKP